VDNVGTINCAITCHDGEEELRMFGRLLSEEEGQTTSEYGLFLGLITLGCIVIVVLLGAKVRNYYSNINTVVISTK